MFFRHTARYGLNQGIVGRRVDVSPHPRQGRFKLQASSRNETTIKGKYNSIRTTFDTQVQTIKKLIVHFRWPAFRLDLLDGDALGPPARGLRIGDGQNAVLHRRLDVLGL